MVAAVVLNVLVIVYLLRLSFSLDHSPVPSLFRDAKQKRGNVQRQNGDDVLLGGYPREISFTKHVIKLDTWSALIRSVQGIGSLRSSSLLLYLLPSYTQPRFQVPADVLAFPLFVERFAMMMLKFIL